ncbi:7174_t:CDS:2 [Ambispora gerdemannii]|uniref:7174_t:CDS:1 n=1 Tax=Ambispora gerdemannii TaxID=144530 RepID=A0A9N8ZK60_9GLOM|nr:7174_t:CDS:2 [Ambispora gerdemannii]
MGVVSGKLRWKSFQVLRTRSDNKSNENAHLDLNEVYKADVLEDCRTISGRRYHNVQGVQYFLPLADESREKWRLETLSMIWKNAHNGRRFSAPMHEKLEKGARILDVGCAAGSWLLDMAICYPKSSFVGVDISSEFIPENEKPKNVIYLQYNVLDGLPFCDSSFDMVYERCLISAFNKSRLITFIEECVRVTKPGGWIESHEMEAMFRGEVGPTTKRLLLAMNDFLKIKGCDARTFSTMSEYFAANGKIENIGVEKNSIPVGSWAGPIGALSVEAINEGWLSLKPVMQITLGVNDQEYNGLLGQVRIEGSKYRATYRTHRVFGQKIKNVSESENHRVAV